MPDHVEDPDRFDGQLRGEVIAGAGGPVRYALDGEIIELDLAEVTYCDSSGLRVFIKLSNELAARGGRLRLVRPSPAVLRLVDLTNTASILGLPPGVP